SRRGILADSTVARRMTNICSVGMVHGGFVALDRSKDGITPSGKLRACPASIPQSCDNSSMHCTAALPARQLQLLVMPMQKENASRADDAYSGDELNLPRSYCRRPPRSPQHPPTNSTARATKPDAIQGARPREATKPTTTCTTNPNCRERTAKHRRI